MTRGRMEEVYRRRERLHPPGFYSMLHPGQAYMIQRRERLVLDCLRELGWSSFANRTILDVGCAKGEWLLRFQSYGCLAANLAGVELQSDFIRQARRNLPGASLAEADASCLPFRSGCFDLVHQATMMTLVPEAETRRRIAAEMLRVLRPDGAVLWFDMRYSNPRNADMSGIRMRELRALFPGCEVRVRSVTLLPALARRIAPWSFTACRLLEGIPPLRIHYLGTIRPIRR